MIAAPVDAALAGIRSTFSDAELTVESDGGGGAFVMLDRVDLGERYVPASSWYGFHLSPLLPDADVYPLYLDGTIARADGQPHHNPAIQSVAWRDRQALQLSRRSTRRNAAIDTPALKALNVLHWFREL